MPPVIGSESLNARQERLLPLAERRPGRAVGLGGRVVGAGRAPASASRGRPPCSSSVGNGASYAARTSSAIPRTQPAADQPADVEHLGRLDGVAEHPPDLRHVEVAGRQPGVRRDHAGEPVGMLGHQPQPDQPAPVLADQRHVAQVEVVEGELAHPLDVPRERVVRHRQRLVGPAEPDQVRRDAPDPGVGQHRDHVPVEERPRRLAVQQQRDRPVRAARRRRTPSAACRRRRSATSAYDGGQGKSGRSAKRSSGVR